jgi:predicted RNA-binding Zn-ribbon protein involved in translation (DUF1610 family)
MKSENETTFTTEDVGLFNGNQILTCTKCKENFEVRSGLFLFCPACGRRIQ